jgi:hypothetical protein
MGRCHFIERTGFCLALLLVVVENGTVNTHHLHDALDVCPVEFVAELVEQVFFIGVYAKENSLCLVAQRNTDGCCPSCQQVLVGDVFKIVTRDILPCEGNEVVASASDKALEEELVTVYLQTGVLREVVVIYLVTLFHRQVEGRAVELLVTGDVSEAHVSEIAHLDTPVKEHVEPLDVADDGIL